MTKRSFFALASALVLTACGLLVGDTGIPPGVADAGASHPECASDGSAYGPDAANPDNPCQVCEIDGGVGAWTNASNGSTCGVGLFCNGGTCASGCSIDGAFVLPGEPTNNGCEVCAPDASTSSWTDLTGAATCPSGNFCNEGSCEPGCVVDGGFVAPGAANPDNACEICAPTGTPLPWITGCKNGGTCASGVCVGPPSCALGGNGLTTCGADAGDNCCASPEVPGGTFDQTYLYEADAAINENTPATVSNFRLDKYLVTVGRFRQFVNAVYPPDGGEGWLPPSGSGKHTYLNQGQGLVSGPDDAGAYETGWDAGWDDNVEPTYLTLVSNCAGGAGAGIPTTWTADAGSAHAESLPIDCVNWYEAYAFCIWDNAFLPTIAEWEYAAAGGAEQREYPWGEAPPGKSYAYAVYDCYFPHPSSPVCYHDTSNIAPVGTAYLGVGAFGQLDMAGEMLEWAFDYATNYVYPLPCDDCWAATPSSSRWIKGSRWSDKVDYLDPLNNNESPSVATSYDLGFRCARAP